MPMLAPMPLAPPHKGEGKAVSDVPRRRLPRADVEAYLLAQESKDLLRFITCGSVDDGKSTLIGRLLYESKLLFDDQLSALEGDSRKFGTPGGDLDFALLVDGLAAEREQGITIDVAYRFFTTDRRKFIVADTPGHEQYTRNMATGASTADLAVILIDARKGVLTQTRRHSFIVSLLGIREVVLAVNKMDLVGYDRRSFSGSKPTIGSSPATSRSSAFCASPSLPSRATTSSSPARRCHGFGPDAAPPSGDGGDRRRPIGEPLPHAGAAGEPPQPAVPRLCRNAGRGRAASRRCRKVMPSGRTSRVDRIVTIDRDLPEAVAGQAVTVTLADEIDVSRGDVLCAPDAALTSPTSSKPTCCGWMPADASGPALFISSVAGIGGALEHPKYKINVNTLEHTAAKTLDLNEIGVCNLDLGQPVPFAPYRESRDLGGFIVIDRFTNNTVGMGVINFALRRAPTPLAGGRCAQGSARRPRPPEAVRVVVHRPVGRRQIDDRQPGREEAARQAT